MDTFLWLLHRITGLLLIGGIAVHLSSLYTGFALSFNRAFLLLFLCLLVFHGVYGLWGITVEYVNSKQILRAVRIILFITALLMIISGMDIITP